MNSLVFGKDLYSGVGGEIIQFDKSKFTFYIFVLYTV